MNSSEAFLTYSAEKLNQSCGRIIACLDRLTEDQIWMRGEGDAQNAIGNLVLHLCGNVRQWILFGVAGERDVRRRDEEFAATGGMSIRELKDTLSATIEQAVIAIRTVPASGLDRRTSVQGYDISCMEAIYHVVEHFSYHTGQIIFATKWVTGEDLGFYRHLHQPSHSEDIP